MDDAEVRVIEDPCAGTGMVELVDLPSGHRAVMGVEEFTPEACGSGPAAALAQAAVAAPSE